MGEKTRESGGAGERYVFADLDCRMRAGMLKARLTLQIYRSSKDRGSPGQGWGNPWHQAAARLGADAQRAGMFSVERLRSS